jgi:hypothetical protein
MANSLVSVQAISRSEPSTPSWFGEVVLVVTHLKQQGVLTKLCERVRFARRRFGRYDVIDFLAVLFGYAISGERTLEEFYERLRPFAVPFMALFERDRLPSRSALSRFLAALTEEPVEALRTLFLDDLLSRPLTVDKQTGGLMDRGGNSWVVIDLDGTREAARQRALPQTDDLPPAFRRLDEVCAPGYRGRKRGQVVRTRTTVSQAHSFQWLGSFGNRGNGKARVELRQGLAAITRYVTAHRFPPARALLRLDGLYGTGAVLSDVAGFAFVTRGKEYSVLGHPLVQARPHLPPDQFQQRPESQTQRSLYDCPEIPVGPEGVLCRAIVATHPAGKKKSPVGVTHAGVVYELFFTNLPQHASLPAMWSSCTCIAAPLNQPFLMRTRRSTRIVGAVIRPGDRSAGRWYLNGSGISAWNWGIGITEFVPALPSRSEPTATRPASSAPVSGYGPPTAATSWKAGRFSGQDFPLQPDGTLRCPAGSTLVSQERRREADGSLRVVYGASIRSCRPCPLREQCQWNGGETAKPRQVSVLLHPLVVDPAPLQWRDWS